MSTPSGVHVGIEAAEPGFPSPSAALRSLLILGVVGFVVTLESAMTPLLIEPMKHELALSDVQIGLLQGTAFGLAYGVTSMPLGRLIDSRNRMRLMSIGVVLYVGAMAGSALAGGIALLLACRALVGAVSALLLPAALSLLADLFRPDRRPVATSLFVVGQACGQATGILVGGIALDDVGRLLLRSPARFGGLTAWRVLYLAAAATSLLLLPLLAAMREPARQEREAQTRALAAALRELWSYRGFIAPVIGGLLFSTVALTGPTTWAAPLLTRSYGLAPSAFAGWLSAVTLAAGILGSLAGGQLAKLGLQRLGPGGVLVPAFVAATAIVPLSCFALAAHVGLFGAMLGLLLFCFGLIQTVGVLAFTLNIPNEIRGLGLGVYTLVAALLGTATAPAAIAVVSRALGGEAMLGPALAAVGAPSAILAAACFGLAISGHASRQSA